jgi:hypothetical protein
VNNEVAMNKATTKRKAYGSFSLFGVPYGTIDIKYAAEELLETYKMSSTDMMDAMRAILEQNERVVSRCSMLMSFSGTIITIFLFIATRSDALLASWQKTIYYITMSIWVMATMSLLYSLKHTFPAPWEYHTEDDFMLTASLFLRRMGLYNICLFVTIGSFLIITYLLLPISTELHDKLFR